MFSKFHEIIHCLDKSLPNGSKRWIFLNVPFDNLTVRLNSKRVKMTIVRRVKKVQKIYSPWRQGCNEHIKFIRIRNPVTHDPMTKTLLESSRT